MTEITVRFKDVSEFEGGWIHDRRLALARKAQSGEFVTEDGVTYRPVREDDRIPYVPRFGSGYTVRDGKLVVVKPRCEQYVRHGRASDPCGRDAVFVVREGDRARFVCKTHLSGMKRSARADQKRQDEGQRRRALDDAAKAAAQERCDELAAAGIEATPHWRHDHRLGLQHTGGIVLDHANADRLIELLRTPVGR